LALSVYIEGAVFGRLMIIALDSYEATLATAVLLGVAEVAGR